MRTVPVGGMCVNMIRALPPRCCSNVENITYGFGTTLIASMSALPMLAIAEPDLAPTTVNSNSLPERSGIAYRVTSVNPGVTPVQPVWPRPVIGLQLTVVTAVPQPSVAG